MKTLLAIIGTALIIFVGAVFVVMKKVHAPCEQLIDISNKPEALSMLFEKLTFYFSDPTYLSQYETIRNDPISGIRFSSRINHGLGINWESLGIDSSAATFSFRGRPGTQPLDYRNLEAEKVSVITIGIGARFHLLFEIEDDISNPEYYSNPSSVRYSVKVECHK